MLHHICKDSLLDSVSVIQYLSNIVFFHIKNAKSLQVSYNIKGVNAL